MAQQKTQAQQAADLAQQILGPQIRSTEEAYRNQGAGVNAAYQAAAQLQRGIAPAIQQTYDAASAREAVIAKGLALGAQLAGAETAGAANQTLANNNSPQQVKAADIGSVLASLGGLNAQSLNDQGAAFSSAARFLPVQSLNLGVDAVKQARNAGTAAVSALEARRPELIQGALNQIQDSRRADRSLNLQERGVRLQEREANRPNSQIFGSGETGYMTFDSKTGKVVRLTDPVPAGADPPQLIGSSDTGYYAWNAGEGTITPVLAPATKPKYTPQQLRGIKQDAANMAYDAFWGIKDKDGELTSQPKHYQEALAWLMNEGQVPLAEAQAALNRWWKKPGFAADAKQRAEGKTYFFKPTQKGVTGRPVKPIQERKPQGESLPVDPAAEANANQYGGTTITPTGKNGAIPGWNDKTIPSKIRNVLAVAHAQIGKPYVWGAESPAEGGFDCSGLIEYAFEQAGIPTPGRLTTYSMMNLGKPVKGPYKPGDWIIVNGGKHVVMYVGKGQVIAAPRRGETVQYQPVDRFKGQIVAVRRFT